ncbi:serine/threonine/tyrosine-interacting-like protein 1 isoform X2 [Accipiter gentilis]|uniref:serine/threonine/tyrosine-interacting-like protein 1 isoform X2 n=1 Tax=Astur gentilis TaxID=8957 RepID=UPI00210F8692|nr:serine/threonine/tyrosine-interacting-like protein 1 isoform X2 [Accipiter gentilis]
MAGMELCEPGRLYNILNQQRRVSRLAEPNYLCLLDARTQREYDESHIITARRIEQSPTGEYLVPDSEELGCVRYCVVYDCETSSLDCCDYEEEEKEKDAEEGTAVQYARSLEQFTRHPVLVLRGGYKRFSACYHFLRTQKILWMPQELDNFHSYPVEILPAKLYMGNFKQACDQQIQKDLKIKAQVNISEQPATVFAEGSKYLHISVPDSLEADLFSSFATICHFIDAQLDHGAVLVFSSLGISRSSTATMAYLMHSCQFSLKRAWDYVLKCKTNMRPHRGFVKQLSDWETQIYGATITDISEPNY